MTSWMVVPPTAWRPPPITFPIGRGRDRRDRPPRYRNSGVPDAAAAAFAFASETAVATLQPMRAKFRVPSISRNALSRPPWSATSVPLIRGPTDSWKIRIAASTPPSGNALGSWAPVLAPLGAAARPVTFAARISTSIVAFPRLSRIFRIEAPSIEGIREPPDVQRRTPGGELSECDVEWVGFLVQRRDRRRSHGNLQSARADDPGPLETSVRQRGISDATKVRAAKKVSAATVHLKWCRTTIK